MLRKLDTKTIIILALTILIVLLLIFRPSKTEVDIEREKRIEKLESDNERLLNSNDSLEVVAGTLSSEIIDLKLETIEKLGQLDDIQYKLDELIKRRDEIRDWVDSMDASGVAESFSEYLKRRSNNNR
jgi:hypothetical protein